MGFKDTDFYPENFILLGNPDSQKAYAEAIVSEAKTRFPERFEGKKDYFSFELRYVAPFDKNFKELKRLQGTAAEVAGRRDEFKGYIIMDLSGYLTHESEDYFDIALHFLVDMSDDWKYILLVDSTNFKAARGLTGHVLNVFVHDNIPCEVKEADAQPPYKSLVNVICKEQNVVCSPPVKELLQELLTQKAFDKDVVSALLRDVSWHCGQRISMSTLGEFFSKREPVVKYMLNEKEYNRLMTVVEQRKENWYGEKEAI